MTPHPRAIGLRRDLARVEAAIRAADDDGRDRLALALSDEACAIVAEIAAAEDISVLGLLTERVPAEAIA